MVMQWVMAILMAVIIMGSIPIVGMAILINLRIITMKNRSVRKDKR